MPKTFTEDQFPRVIKYGEQEYLVCKRQIEKGDYYLMSFGPDDEGVGDYEVMEAYSSEDADRATNHPTISQSCYLILASSDSSLNLPTIKEYYLEQAHHRFEAANYHREFHMVEEAVEYMSEEKAIEYLKQVDIP